MSQSVSSQPVIEVNHLSKAVTDSTGTLEILRDIHFSLQPQETAAIVGASGSGKSTLLSMLAGLDTPSQGTVRVQGQDIFALDEDARAALRGQKIGFVFQSFQLLPNLTALENVMLPLELAGVRAARQQAVEMLQRVGLGQRLQHYPKLLSGGEQQRVALARALITQPRVLLLDEPLSALDPFLRIQMRAELRRWQKELGLTFIHVTHSQEEAMALADTMVVMNHGVIEQVGSPHEVYNRPASEFVARFMGGHNVIDTPEGKVGVRTDHLQIAPAHAELPWGAQRMQAVVTDVEYQGTYVLVGLQKHGAVLSANATAAYSVMVSEAAFAAQPYQVGQGVQLHWTPEQAHPLSSMQAVAA